MSTASPTSAPATSGGRHRAAATPGRTRRAVLATLAAGLPLVPAVVMAGPAHAETDWDKLAQCESGGDWSINTGNGFSGGLQFTPSTWKAFGGSGNAKDAGREEQIQVAEKVKAAQGMNAWPTCSKKTGQTDSSPNSGGSSSDGSSSDESSSAGSSSTGSSDDADEPSRQTSETATKATTEKPALKKATTEKAAGTKASSSGSSSAGSTAKKAAAASTYTVEAGDTLSTIASSQGVDGGWAALRDANTSLVTDPHMIFPGQALALN